MPAGRTGAHKALSHARVGTRNVKTVITRITPDQAEQVRQFLLKEDSEWTWRHEFEATAAGCIVRTQPKDPSVHFDDHDAATEQDFWTEHLYNEMDIRGHEVDSRIAY